jgi:hypothetical protein
LSCLRRLQSWETAQSCSSQLNVKHQATEEALVSFDESGAVCCCFHGVNGKMIFIENKNRDKKN